MKKILLLKKFAFLFMLALLFSGPLFAQDYLIFITDTTKFIQDPYEPTMDDTLFAEQHIINMFLEDGYDVTVMQYPPTLSTADQSLRDELDLADLIYIGRPCPSVTFQDPEKQAWNEIYAPIMTENMWALRNSRMNWFNTTNINSATVEDSAIVNAALEDPGDDVFDGLEDMFPGLDLSDSIPFWYGPWDCINPAEVGVGNGTVMATLAGGEVCWVRFDDKDEFYNGSVDAPAGERVFFGLGHDNGGALPRYYARWTEVSKEIWLREAARLSGHSHGEPGVRVENHNAVTSRIFFNPLSQRLVVEMDNLTRVEVIDISGKLIYSTPAESNRMSVDLGFAARGIYLVKCTDKNKNFSTAKILK